MEKLKWYGWRVSDETVELSVQQLNKLCQNLSQLCRKCGWNSAETQDTYPKWAEHFKYLIEVSMQGKFIYIALFRNKATHGALQGHRKTLREQYLPSSCSEPTYKLYKHHEVTFDSALIQWELRNKLKFLELKSRFIFTTVYQPDPSSNPQRWPPFSGVMYVR